jgi:hypothetical protein
VKKNKEQGFKKFLDELVEKNNSHKALPKIPNETMDQITNDQWLYLYTHANRGSHLEQMALANMRKRPS